MSRKSVGDFSRPRFGKLLGVIIHKGMDREKHTLLRVKWQAEDDTVYHPTMGVLVCLRALDPVPPSYVEPKDLVPYDFFGMPNPHKPTGLCMLATDGWHIMRHLGFDPPPSFEYVF